MTEPTPDVDEFSKDKEEYHTTVEIDLNFGEIDEHVTEKHSELMYGLLDVLREYQGVAIDAETTPAEGDTPVAETNLDWAHSPDRDD